MALIGISLKARDNSDWCEASFVGGQSFQVMDFTRPAIRDLSSSSDGMFHKQGDITADFLLTDLELDMQEQDET